MKKWARDVRLMPIVLLAIVCLLVLKTMGLLFDGGYTLGQRLGSGGTLTVTTVPMAQTQQMRSPSVPLEMPQGAPKQPSFMQEMFGYPGGDRSAVAGGRNPDITGSVAAKPAEKKKEEPPANKEPPVPVGAESIAARGTVVSMDQQRPASPGERALLERLQERRQELEARMREIELRESLVKAAEKKLETGPPEGDKAARGPGGQSRDEPNPRLKGVVTMYETMKPKDAAKIFDRLDPKVLLEVASQIKPQRMSEIMAVMSPEAAERLTVELATQGPSDRTVNPANLPKIDGKPGG